MLECVCDFGCEFIVDAWRHARKAHRCEECGKTIVPGERYRYVMGKQDGDVWQAKCCEHCDDLWANLTDLGFCRMWGGVLFESLTEYYDEQVIYDEDKDEYVLHNGRTPHEQASYLANKSRALP